jgi:hypothetical protein
MCAVVASSLACAQSALSNTEKSEVRAHLELPAKPASHAVPAVIWLEPTTGTPALPFLPHGHYTLLQKNRMFMPHLLVVPVGSIVAFPNADPFFHNVFSLFDGKRFDLGLYEAGSSKELPFIRPGVSYIFCNIHPEMSAVVLALSTPLFAVADGADAFLISDVPPGDYKLLFWVEGIPQATLNGLTRHVHIPPGPNDLGGLHIPTAPQPLTTHTNKFGQPYDPSSTNHY